MVDITCFSDLENKCIISVNILYKCITSNQILIQSMDNFGYIFFVFLEQRNEVRVFVEIINTGKSKAWPR